MLKYSAVVFKYEWYKTFRYTLVACRDHDKPSTDLKILYGSIIGIIDQGQKNFNLGRPVTFTFTESQVEILVDIARLHKIEDAYQALTGRELFI